MQLSKELIMNMLTTLDEHPYNFIMISDFAKKIGHFEGPCALSDEFTNHLLHLQDLHCFVNSVGVSEFGHQATEKNDCEEKFTHCFKDQLIRINAKGRELLDVLSDDNITEKGKSSALRIGGEVVTSILVKALSGG